MLYKFQIILVLVLFTMKRREDEKMSKLDEVQWQYLKKSLDEMEYGSVVITVHDGRVTQIDTTEKKRFTNNNNRSLQKCK